MKRGIPFALLLALTVPGLLSISACGKGASPSEPPSSPIPSPATTLLAATPTPSPPVLPRTTTVGFGKGKARPVMGVMIRGVEIEGKVMPLKNGQRLSLSDGLFLEVYVVPYSSSYDTDLHLFPLRGETPLKGAKVGATLDMPEMGHPDFPQIGREVEEGDYGLPLDLYMFGDWHVDIDIRHPEFNTYLRVLLQVYAWRGE